MIEKQYYQNINRFVHFLRDNGFNIGIKELTDTMDILTRLEHPEPASTFHTLRSLSCHNKDQWQQFNQLFQAYWGVEDIEQELNNNNDTIGNTSSNIQSGSVSGIAGASTNPFETIVSSDLTGAGRQNTITKADFRFLNNKQAMREAEYLAEKLALNLKSRTRLQRKASLKGKRIDVRQTIRRNMSFGAIPMQPIFSIKLKKPPHIVILHDVSHSMNWNNPLLFRFARGLIKTCSDSEAFVFHTRLFCVTKLYREKSIKQMRDKLESRNHLWLGGTCIAESLNHFNRHFAKSVLRSDSVVLLISDGLDTDAPSYLAKELASIRDRVRKVFWLDPMQVRRSDISASPTIQAAAPYIDRFVPAHSVESLRQITQSISA